MRRTFTQKACYVLASLITLLSFFPAYRMSLHSGCSLTERLAYPFFHANIFHALLNLYVLRQCMKSRCVGFSLFVFYLIAVSYPMASTRPIVGLSGLIYAYMGYLAPLVVHKTRYHLAILAYLAVGLIIPCMAFGVHAYCYALGLIWGYLTLPLWKDR